LRNHLPRLELREPAVPSLGLELLAVDRVAHIAGDDPGSCRRASP
jgi:hypothetical protein